MNRESMKRILLLFAFAGQSLFPVTSGAEHQMSNSLKTADTLALRLQESVLIALENNPTVTIQRLSPEIAETYSRGERAVFDPSLSLTASRSETKQQRFLGSRPDPFEMTSERRQYDLSVTEKLPTGTEISAEVSITGSISSIYTDQYTGTIGLTVTQSLLRGFGIGNNLANLRKTRIDVDISLLELEAMAEQVVADVEKAYWDLFLAKEEMHIQRRSLELAEKQLSESRERVAVGRLPELELAAVHAEVATRRESMIDAQSRYEQARLHFLFLLNLPQEHNWDIIPLPQDQPFVPVDTLDTVQNHEHLGLKYRADLQQAQLQLKRNEVDLAQTRNGLLPLLDVFITLGRTTYAQSFGESIPDLESPFYDISAGVTFEFPLPNRQARAQHERSQYTQDQLELALSNMEQLIRRDVRSAYIEVVRSRQQIEATLVARDLQEKKLLAEQEKFRVGKSTNFLVLQAQRDFVASQLNEARAKVAYLNALVDLYMQEGTLLERRGIESYAIGQ